MGTYHQYCPVARASEILAERWNPLIVRNLMFGADTFSAIARGVPTMSRSMLLKRLEELERAGVIQSRPKPEGRGHLYGLTEAGADLAGVIDGLAAWGERWMEVTTERSDPGFALWAWCQVQLNRAALPAGRVVVALIFPDERADQPAVLAAGRARRRGGVLLRPRRRTRPDGGSRVAGVRRLAPRRSVVARRAASRRPHPHGSGLAASILPNLEPDPYGTPLIPGC